MSPADNPKDGRVLIRQGMIIPVEGLKQDVVANHEEMEFGFSSRYLSRNRQRQWHQPGFTIVCSENNRLFILILFLMCAHSLA